MQCYIQHTVYTQYSVTVYTQYNVTYSITVYTQYSVTYSVIQGCIMLYTNAVYYNVQYSQFYSVTLNSATLVHCAARSAARSATVPPH